MWPRASESAVPPDDEPAPTAVPPLPAAPEPLPIASELHRRLRWRRCRLQRTRSKPVAVGAGPVVPADRTHSDHRTTRRADVLDRGAQFVDLGVRGEQLLARHRVRAGCSSGLRPSSSSAMPTSWQPCRPKVTLSSCAAGRTSPRFLPDECRSCQEKLVLDASDVCSRVRRSPRPSIRSTVRHRRYAPTCRQR